MKEKTNKATLTTSEGTGGHNNKPLNQFEITTVTLSAVEWLQEQYNQCPKYEERIYEQDWGKAKEMEKEQSLKVPEYDLDKLAENEFPYDLDGALFETLGITEKAQKSILIGMLQGTFQKGFKKAIQLLTFKSE